MGGGRKRHDIESDESIERLYVEMRKSILKLSNNKYIDTDVLKKMVEQLAELNNSGFTVDEVVSHFEEAQNKEKLQQEKECITRTQNIAQAALWTITIGCTVGFVFEVVNQGDLGLVNEFMWAMGAIVPMFLQCFECVGGRRDKYYSPPPL